MYKAIIGPVTFFILDVLLLWGMFILCTAVFDIQSTILRILLSNIVAVPISYYIYKRIVKQDIIKEDKK